MHSEERPSVWSNAQVQLHVPQCLRNVREAASGDPCCSAHCAAGDDLLSRVVNAAINFKPLFALMKVCRSRRRP